MSFLWFDDQGVGVLLRHFLEKIWRTNTCCRFYTPLVKGVDRIISHGADALFIPKDDDRNDYVDAATGQFRMDHILVHATREWPAYVSAPWPAAMEPIDMIRLSQIAIEMNAFASRCARYYGVIRVHQILFKSTLWKWFQTLMLHDIIPLDIRYHVFMHASVQCRKHMRKSIELPRLSDRLGALLPHALNPASHQADAAMLAIAQQEGIFPRRVCTTWDEFCREAILSVREYLQREHIPRLPDDMIGAIAQWLPFKKARYLFSAYRMDEEKCIEYATWSLRARDPGISPEAISILKNHCGQVEPLFRWIRAYQRFRVSSVGCVIYVTDIVNAMLHGHGYFFSQATLKNTGERADIALCNAIVSSATIDDIQFDKTRFCLVQNPQPPPLCRTFL